MRILGGNVPHRRRPPLSASVPVHVTLVVKRDLRLRKLILYPTLREAFRRGRERFGFRLCHFSIRQRRIHLLCEAADRRSLWRGMQGLAVRIAKRLNRSLAARARSSSRGIMLASWRRRSRSVTLSVT
jgi:REP-associated tyrosine transposase